MTSRGATFVDLQGYHYWEVRDKLMLWFLPIIIFYDNSFTFRKNGCLLRKNNFTKRLGPSFKVSAKSCPSEFCIILHFLQRSYIPVDCTLFVFSEKKTVELGSALKAQVMIKIALSFNKIITNRFYEISDLLRHNLKSLLLNL